MNEPEERKKEIQSVNNFLGKIFDHLDWISKYTDVIRIPISGFHIIMYNAHNQENIIPLQYIDFIICVLQIS